MFNMLQRSARRSIHPFLALRTGLNHAHTRSQWWFIAGLFLAATADPAAAVTNLPVKLASPDGALTMAIEVKDFGPGEGCVVYRVGYRGKTIIADSRLGLEIQGGPSGEGWDLTKVSHSQHDINWRPVCGERSVVRDHYNQVVLELKERRTPHRVLQVMLRAYDEGVAFCYTVPKQSAMDRINITRENSEFRFLADHFAWATDTAQGIYQRLRLSKLNPGCERPLTIEVADDAFVALAEARLVDYARMKFAPLPGTTNAILSLLGSSVESPLPLTTPWRVIMIANSPGRLLENNFIIANLNDPCAIADTSWIKPGKVLREVTLTTQGGKACVDFAVRRNLQYVLFDAGWYGREDSEQSDAHAVNLDPARSKGPLDLPEVIRYANERGVGVILYINRRALERQLDELFPLYQSWGVKGVKFGFVNVGSQQWTAWLHEAIRKAAQHKLMVDVHDEYRPTGFSRTYPNLMTAEGIAGDETSPSNENTLAIQFSRMLAGPADNTVCYYDARVSKNASHAYQLAKTVCLYSPWQFLYWYDRPTGSPPRIGGAGGAETFIGNEPELEFFDRVPTVWDEMKVLAGKIGQYAAIARRSGQDWFIGGMNSGEARTLELPLTFLAPEKTYIANVYSDDPSVETRTHVRIDRFEVNSKTVLKLPMSAQGGQAVHLKPATAK